MTLLKKIILLSLICFCTCSSALENPSLAERIWIKNNLLKPQANLIFVVTISKAMLVTENDQDTVRQEALDFQSMSRLQLQEFIADNSLQQKNPHALLALANRDILAADFKSARKGINKAYELNPLMSEIYLAELMYQLYDALIRLSQNQNSSNKATLMVSTDFLERVENEHPDYEVPKIIHNGLNVLQVFYSAVFRNIEQFKQRKAFKFVLDNDLQELADSSQSYFEQLLKNDAYNPYFSKLCLLMLAIVENDTQAADDYFNTLRGHDMADNNLYRLMTISDIAQDHLSQAIKHIKASITVKDTIDDRLTLASLYSLKADHFRAIKVIADYKGKPSAKLLIHKLGYTLFTGDFNRAAHLYENYRQIPVLQQSPHFVYYALIINVLNERYELASKLLSALADSEELYNNAQQFIRHFKAPEPI